MKDLTEKNMSTTQATYKSYADDGLTPAEIAKECGTTADAVRRALRRIDVKARGYRSQTYRDRAGKMKPIDAVQYLMDIIEMICPAMDSDDHPIDEIGKYLTPTERRIAAFMYDNMDKVYSRSALMDLCYCDYPDEEPEEKIIDIYLCRVRSKLASTNLRIENAWGRGWRMVEVVAS